MKKILYLLAAVALLSSCKQDVGDWYAYYLMNETDKECIVSFEYTEDHQYRTCQNDSPRESPVRVEAKGEDYFLNGEWCKPSKVFTKFTVTTADGDTLYHSEPARDEDWTYFDSDIEHVDHNIYVIRHNTIFTIKDIESNK